MKSSTGRIIFASVVLFVLLLWVFVTFLEPATDSQLIATEETVISRPSRSKFDGDEIDTHLFKRFLEKYGAIPPRVSEVALALPPSNKKAEAEIVSTQATQDNNEVYKSQKVQRDVRILKSANTNNDTISKLIGTSSTSEKLGLDVTTDRKWTDISNQKDNGISNSLTGVANRYSHFYMCDDSNPVQTETEDSNNIKLRNRFLTPEDKISSFKTYNATKIISKLLPDMVLHDLLRNNSKQISAATSHQVRGRSEDYKVVLVNCSQQRIIKKRDLSTTGEFVGEERNDRHGLCPSQPLLSVKDGSGRLGSRLWQYAALWTLPRSLPGLGRLPFVPRRLLRTLRRVFVNVSMPILEDIPLHCKYR